MKPKPQPRDEFELFQAHFDQILNRDHAWVQLADKIDWHRFDAALADSYSEAQARGLLPGGAAPDRARSFNVFPEQSCVPVPEPPVSTGAEKGGRTPLDVARDESRGPGADPWLGLHGIRSCIARF